MFNLDCLRFDLEAETDLDDFFCTFEPYLLLFDTFLAFPVVSFFVIEGSIFAGGEFG